MIRRKNQILYNITVYKDIMKIGFLTAILIVFTTFVAGCDSSSNSSTSEMNSDALLLDGAPFQEVTSVTSPLPGYTGIALDLDDQSQLFLLSENLVFISQLAIEKVSFEGADMENTVGETFFSFSWGNNPYPVGIIKTEASILDVVECDFDYMECSSVPFTEVAERTYSFEVRPELKYAFEKEE